MFYINFTQFFLKLKFINNSKQYWTFFCTFIQYVRMIHSKKADLTISAIEEKSTEKYIKKA
jgi:hypothetical protein